MAQWEIFLGGNWKPMGKEESDFLDGIQKKGQSKGELRLRGNTYVYDLTDPQGYTQRNVETNKSRRIRGGIPRTVPTPPTPVPAVPSGRGGLQPGMDTNAPDLQPGINRMVKSGTSENMPFDEAQVVEVWLAGEWKKLQNEECRQIAQHQAAGEVKFKIQVRGKNQYEIDLENMTQTNLASKRIRTIRFGGRPSDPEVGFDFYRDEFKRCLDSGDGQKELREDQLQKKWPMRASDSQILLEETVRLITRHMDLRQHKAVDMTEWNHYWALERDSPSYALGEDVNTTLREALKKDPQILGRMQMHFETAVAETDSHHGLPIKGLIKTCERLQLDQRDVKEKQWAKEVLNKRGEWVDDEEHELSYFEFLNIMLGRKKFKVELWMYDISDGMAQQWSSLVLGRHFEGIWHTGVVVTWPEKTSEFWFGGALFESEPGTTPFGTPMFKKDLGYTYKLRQEVWNKVARTYAHEFTRETYDVLTHNCNHFSDKLSMFLMNDHIPDEVRLQPELAMNTVTGKVLRPFLNKWLGTMGDEKASKTDGGEEALKMWQQVLPGALIQFSKDEGGRPQVGEVIEIFPEDCVVNSLDFLKGTSVHLDVSRERVSKVLREAPAGTYVTAAVRKPEAASSICCI